MHGAILSVTIASVLAFPAVFAVVTNFAAQNGETLRNVWLTEAGSLVLGSNTSLRRLSAADLSVVEEVSLPEGQVSRLLVGDPGGTYSGRVLSCLRTDCSLLDVNDIASHNWEVSNVLLVDGITNAGGLFVRGREDTSVLTVELQRNGEQVSRIVRGNLVNVGETSGQGFSIFAGQTEGFLYDREYLTIFQNDGFSYFVSKQGLDDETRVVRVCNNDTSSEVADGGFVSYFEIRLECGGSESVPTAAAFLPSDQTITLSAAQSQNLVCVFKLFDIHQLMTQKYDDCRHGMGSTGLARSGTKICEDFGDRLNNSDITECNLVSSLLPFQEVQNPLSAGPVFSLPLSDGNFTSLIHSALDNVRYLFAGTHNGKIYQYHYVSSTSINPIRTINLVSSEEMSGTNVTQLTVASDGLTLYALTPSKLYSITIDVCDTYTSCDACLGESGDPICGWCSLENRCSRQSECSAVWVSDSIGSCPVITSADPSIIYVKELQMGEVDIQLTTANIPEGVSYKCRYGFQGGTSEQVSTTSTVTMVIPATRNNDMFTCRVHYNNVPKIPTNKDSLQSMLSLRYQGNDVAVLDGPVRFANCSVHTNCTSCISSDSQCNWCPFTFKCIAPRNDSCSGVDETVMEYCPKLLPPLDNDNYVIHVDYTYGETPLVIRAENLGQFSDSFSSRRFNCVMKNGAEVLFRTDAVLNADGNVECVETRFDYTLSDGMTSLEARLAVEWIDNDVSIDNPNRTGVTLYTCGGLGTNCAQCLAIPSIFDCDYCKSTSPLSCVLSDRCNDVIDDLGDCELPEIMSVSPSSGPTEGGTVVTVRGTNLAVTRSQIRNVTIAGAGCVIVDDSYQPGIEFQCVTGTSGGGRGSYQVEIEFNYLTMIRRGSSFTYEVPTLDSLSPTRGPQAGGTMVTITGYNLNIGTNLRVTLLGQKCYEETKAVDEITCLSGASEVIGGGVVSVAIDNWSDEFGDGTEYEYVKNPTIASISPRFSFAAGGTEYVVLGQDFDIIQEPRLLIHITTSSDQSESRRRRRQTVEIFQSRPCTTDSGGTRMMCQAPPIDPALFSARQLPAVLGLELDGVNSLRRLDNYTVTLHSNPSFQNFGKRSFSNTDNIRLTIDSQGGRFEFTEEMVEVLITPCSREECVCEDVTFQSGNTSLTCLVGTTSGLRRTSTLTVTAHIGSYNQTVGSIEITGPINPVVFIVPIVVTFVIIVVVIVVILLVVCYRGRQKDSRYKELIVEMEKLESTVARECKLGFAELQTDLDELTGDVSGLRLPYRDLKVYLLSALFPGSKDHVVLHPVQLPIQRQISSQKAIKDFHDLCMDKKVLLLFIRTLEEQRSFSIRDKSLVGSLLMVALHNRLDYATEILKMLLYDLITKAVNKSSPKLLLRRTESVAEKMLTNWLAFCLHGYIVEQTGKPLYLLYRAVKSQLEKGPIDVITGEARYSLSEHKLIRQKMDVEVLSVTVEADDGLRVPVKVLTCDTISQVKEKLLDAIYKSMPVSQRPSLTTIDLELITSPRDYTILRDEDTTTVMDGDWKKLNTLQHYGVEDGAVFRLMKRNGRAPPGRTYDYPASLISSHAVRNRALSEAEDGTRVWHLFKQHDIEDPKRSPFLNKKMITEVYLPRMLSTKNILQKFVSDLFSSLFSVHPSPTSPVAYTNFFPTSPELQPPVSYAPGSTVPMAVKYLLDFLDDSAESAQISERDVVHTWKNNALALRFWVNVMKNPEFVFDVNKSHTVDACLSVIAGAFIDGCSYADVKLTIDSPTSKLLYNKEMQEYKVKVRQYYQNVAGLPRIPEDAMQSYLKQLSEHQSQVFRKTGGFVVESALYELLRYANKYSDQMLSNLRNAGLDARAQVFESVVRATM